MSEDSNGSPPRQGAGAAAAGRITSLSDDSSDDGRPAPAYNARGGGDGGTRGRARGREVVEAHERAVPIVSAGGADVDVLHFPSTVEVPLAVSGDRVPEGVAVLYRVKGGGGVEGLVECVARGKEGLRELAARVESNANLVTWSDGSKTLSIGAQQFLIVPDGVVSKHYIFRRGKDVQTFESEVKSVARVQPSKAADGRSGLGMQPGGMAASAVKRQMGGRSMLMCMDGDGELQEKNAKYESNKRERERARLDSKRRQARERHHRPSRGLTTNALESDYDQSDDDDEKKSADVERLIIAKRAATSEPVGISVKRRKAGGRRMLQDSDEDDSDE